MKRIIIYGMGKRFQSLYFQNNVLPEIEKKYQIVGVSDRKATEYKRYPVCQDKKELANVDLVVITSDIFFEDIKQDLMNIYHVEEKRIVSLDEIVQKITSDILHLENFIGKCGVEVGGPTSLFLPLYCNCISCDGVNFQNETVWWKAVGNDYYYKDKKLGKVILADAVCLESIDDNKYEFYVSSNNLEHIANPLKALLEAVRVVENNGIIMVLVPDNKGCFDHNRPITKFTHILEDYENEVSEYDMTHLEEILELHDFDMDEGVQDKAEFIERAKRNYYNRCLHHHVFDELLLKELFSACGIRLQDVGSIFNNHFAIGEVKK